MAGEWRPSTWGDEISLEYGKALRGHDASTGAFRVFGSNGPIGWTDEPLVPGPGVVLGRKGAYRGVEYSPQPFFVIDTAYYVLSKKQHDIRWLYYAIKYHKLGEIDDGSPIPSTTRAAVYPREVQVPPIAEQRAIAHILGTLDDKIELNRRMSATLEAMARTLFKAWFVDFEPVRAKAEGRWHKGESLPGLPAHLYDLFPNRLVETEQGEIPEGWRWGTLAESADLNPEVWPRATRPKTIAYVDLANTKWGRIESIQTFDATEAPSRAQRVLRARDTIVATVRPGNGSFALVPHDGLTGSTGFAHLRPHRDASSVVYLAATSAENIERLAHLADGAAYPAVRPESVAATPLPIADSAVVGEFERRTADWLGRMAGADNHSRTLSALRDALLPKLISGELRVPNAERFLERVI